MTAEYLRAQGHEVLEGGTGRASLVEVETTTPAVANLDIGLPDMTGYELAAILRHKLPEIRLIAVSGYAAESDRARSTAAGFAKHFAKPVMMKTIVEALIDLA
jgi:CheY-like chemotaxis protein